MEPVLYAWFPHNGHPLSWKTKLRCNSCTALPIISSILKCLSRLQEKTPDWLEWIYPKTCGAFGCWVAICWDLEGKGLRKTSRYRQSRSRIVRESVANWYEKALTDAMEIFVSKDLATLIMVFLSIIWGKSPDILLQTGNLAVVDVILTNAPASSQRQK